MPCTISIAIQNSPSSLLDAERVDVRRVRMIEPRRQLRLAHEALEHDLVVAQPLVQDLDDRLATEQRLLAAIDRAEPALADPLAEHELAERPTAQVVSFHPTRLSARAGAYLVVGNLRRRRTQTELVVDAIFVGRER